MGKITNEDAQSYTLKINNGATSSTSSISSKTTITNVLVSSKNYKIQVVGGGSCSCSGKADVFIRKGNPVAVEPKVKEEKPKPASKPADKKPSTTTKKPAASGASKPARPAAQSSSATADESDEEIDTSDVVEEEEEDIQVQDNGWGPLDPLLLKQRNRDFWNKRSEWGGEETTRDWFALSRLALGNGETCVKDFEEMLDLCTTKEDSWRLLVHVGSAHHQFDSAPHRVLLLDLAVTEAKSVEKVRLILQKIFRFMMHQRQKGNIPLAQKLRLASGLLVYRYIELQGAAIYIGDNFHTFPECSMFPSLKLLKQDWKKFGFTVESGTNGILWERIDYYDAEWLQYPACMEIFSISHIGSQLACLWAKQQSSYYVKDNSGPIGEHFFGNDYIANLGSIGKFPHAEVLRILLMRGAVALAETMFNYKAFNEKVLPYISQQEQLDFILEGVDLIKSDELFAKARQFMVKHFPSTELKLAKMFSLTKRDGVNYSHEFNIPSKPWGIRWNNTQCCDWVYEKGKILVTSIDWKSSFGREMQEMKDELELPPIGEWGPVPVEALAARRHAFWDRSASWGGLKPRDVSKWIPMIMSNTQTATYDLSVALDSYLDEEEENWRILCQTNAFDNGVLRYIKFLLLDRALISPQGIFMAQVLIKKATLLALLARNAGKFEKAQKLRLLSALLVYRVIEANGIVLFMENKMYNWPELCFFPLADLCKANISKFKFLDGAENFEHGARGRIWEGILENKIAHLLLELPCSPFIFFPESAVPLLWRYIKSASPPKYDVLEYFFKSKKLQELAVTGLVPWTSMFLYLYTRGYGAVAAEVAKDPCFQECIVPLLRDPKSLQFILKSLKEITYQTTFDQMAAMLGPLVPLSAQQIEEARKAKTDRIAGTGGLRTKPDDKPFGNLYSLAESKKYVEEKMQTIVVEPNLDTAFGKAMTKLLATWEEIQKRIALRKQKAAEADAEAAEAAPADPTPAPVTVAPQPEKEVETPKETATIKKEKKEIDDDLDLKLDLDLEEEKTEAKKPSKEKEAGLEKALDALTLDDDETNQKSHDQKKKSDKEKPKQKEKEKAKQKEKSKSSKKQKTPVAVDDDLDDMLKLTEDEKKEIDDLDLDDLDLSLGDEDDAKKDKKKAKKPKKKVVLTDDDLNLDL